MKRFLYLVAADQISGGASVLVKPVLWMMSQIYGFLILSRRILYDAGLLQRCRLSAPVISVGNLTVGGTGKTPLVELIARILKEKKVRPIILTRGYMGETKKAGGQNSDEALMLRDALIDVPVLAGADRVKNARAYSKKNKVDVFLLDDGFQHWRLFRDLDMVVVDTTNPWGNGHLLPRGILREPREALSRAHMFVLTKTDIGRNHLQDIKKDLSAINPRALMVETVHKPICFLDGRSGVTEDLSLVKGRTICAVSSIGTPDSLTKTLITLGADVKEHAAFMDHHSYGPGDMEQIMKLCREQETAILVTTEKDAVKLKLFFNLFPPHIRILFLRIKMSIVHGEEAFLERIYRLL